MQSRAGEARGKEQIADRGWLAPWVTLGKSLALSFSFLVGNLRRITPLTFVVRLT